MAPEPSLQWRLPGDRPRNRLFRIMWLCSPQPQHATCPRSSRCPWPAARRGGTGSAGPAVDLVNTLRERWRRRVETLVTPDDLGLWLVRAQLAPVAAVTRARLGPRLGRAVE